MKTIQKTKNKWQINEKPKAKNKKQTTNKQKHKIKQTQTTKINNEQKTPTKKNLKKIKQLITHRQKIQITNGPPKLKARNK